MWKRYAIILSVKPSVGLYVAPLGLDQGNAQRNGWKPRQMKCSKCGFIHDRDVVEAMNLFKNTS